MRAYMWNTNYSLPTLVLLLIIVVAFFGRRRIPTRRNRVFAALLVTAILTMVADYASTRMDEAGGMFPDPALWAVNYVFFAFFVGRSFLFFLFACELLGAWGKAWVVKGAKVLFALEQAFVLVGSIVGWIFRIDGGAYASGSLYQFVNVQFAVWIVLALAIAAWPRRSRSVRVAGAYAYLLILLLGLGVRVAFPHVVVMNLFCMFAIQVIYLWYMNPDQYIDDTTLLFNSRGWNRVLDDALLDEEFCMVAFGLRDFSGLQQMRGNRRLKRALGRVGTWVRRSWPQFSNYYLGNGIFVLASMKPFDQNAVLDGIARRFELPWESQNGEYFLSVNAMVMMPGLRNESKEVLRGTLHDSYRLLTQSEAIATVKLDGAAVREHVRRGEVHRILADALAGDELEMFLQPIVEAATGRVRGAEALCRIANGKGGYLFPDEFIPLALKDGTLGVLGNQMFRRACDFMSRADVRGRLDWVNVNVAPEQFKNPRLVDEFLEMLAERELEPAQVHLEVTEETMIDRALLHDSMASFRAHGFVFAMDDFGSSYSNMIRLQQNSFSCVKIDRDFTWSHFAHPTALLPDVVKTCHDLGIEVVVEGVETEEMADGVREIGADYIQGYYYSRPLKPDAFAQEYLAS